MIQSVEPVYHEIGKRIRRERKRYNLTLMDLAERVGLTNPSHLSAIERGIQRVQLHTLQSIARELDIPMAWLLLAVEEGEVPD